MTQVLMCPSSIRQPRDDERRRLSRGCPPEDRGARVMIRSTFLALALSAVSLAVPGIAQEAPSARTMLILDGSGSMWGRIDGTPKIEIARGAIDTMLRDWPEGREIGLMAYGHRREGDCSDIELLRAPGPLDRAALRARME